MHKTLIFGAILMISSVAIADSLGYRKLDALFLITGPIETDAPRGQKADRVAIFISGKGAKAIFDAMPRSPIPKSDLCEERMLMRKSGGLRCAKPIDGEYTCSVAILLENGATRKSGSC